MKNRFHAPTLPPAGELLELDGQEFHHARVTRVRIDEEIEIFDGVGGNVGARVVAVESDRIRALVGQATIASREPLGEIRLAMALIQPEKFELVLQKATELGVSSFIPLITDRIEIRLERISGKVPRWERIIFEAVKQSGRARIPQIVSPVEFSKVIAEQGHRILFDADEQTRQSDTSTGSGPSTLLIGPEGGWSERELTVARESGTDFERLGPRRLRAETAAIVALTLVSARVGNL